MTDKRVVFLVYNDFDGDSRVERTAKVAQAEGHDVFVLATASKRYPTSSVPRIINGIKVLHVDQSALRRPPLARTAIQAVSLLAEATKIRFSAKIASVAARTVPRS